MRQQTVQKKNNETKKDFSKTYNQFKEFQGKQYSGMKVRRSHKWYYDKGEWKEKKITRANGNSPMLFLRKGQDMLRRALEFL
jgi:hypothetical protein